MANYFIWFIWALAITITNVIFSFIIYYYLGKKTTKKRIETVRDMSMLYSLGMLFAILFAVIIFMISFMQ